MAVPLNENKYTSPSVTGAAQFLEYLCNKTGKPVDFPESVIICYQHTVTAYVKGNYTTDKVRGLPLELLRLKEFDGRVGVLHQAGFGAPAAVVSLEFLIACGVTRIISMGSAGCLQPELQCGDIILCSEALRDEGTSYHYQPAARCAYPSQQLTAALAGQLQAAQLPFTTGPSWTTDAIFRETAAEVSGYQQAGILTVEMEAAALFTVAAFRNAELAAAFVVSDHLAGGKWQPAFTQKKVSDRLNRVFDTAAVTLAACQYPNVPC